MAPIKTAIAETRRRKLRESTSKKRKGEGATDSVAKAKASTPYRHRKESSDASDFKGMAPGQKVKPIAKAAKKAVKQAKKTVKAAAKTVKKATGTPLASKNTYTTSGTHAGGRKSSASRKIKQATSLKRAARG